MNPWLIAGPTGLAAVAAGIAAYGAAYPRSQIFGRTVCRTNSPQKLALTFDDGPNPAITPKLLDLLDRYKARATFFVIGKHARECPDLLKETAARGTSSAITRMPIPISFGLSRIRSPLSFAAAIIPSSRPRALRRGGSGHPSERETRGWFPSRAN